MSGLTPEIKREQRNADLSALMNTGAGQRFLAAFFLPAREKLVTSDTNQAFYATGRRDFAEEILARLREADFASYQKLERIALQGEAHG